jgi:hypothetical protein
LGTEGNVNGIHNWTYNWIVNWGDGTEANYAAAETALNTGSITKTYAAPGQYQIAIRPNGAMTMGWMNAFGVFGGGAGNNTPRQLAFRSIDTPLTNNMRSIGNATAGNRLFDRMFWLLPNMIGIPENLFSAVRTTGRTDFTQMFIATFAASMVNSPTATIPVGLLDFLDMSSAMLCVDMFQNMFQSAFRWSTEATVPVGLFSKVNTSRCTTFGSYPFGGTLSISTYRTATFVANGEVVDVQAFGAPNYATKNISRP